jgi:AI-2 transport protein TqsA
VFVQQFPEKLPLQRMGLHPMNFQIPSTMYLQMSSWVGEVTGFASAVILVIIFTLFILLGRPAARPTRIGVLTEIEDRVQRYITQMVMLSAISGIAAGIVLAACGVKFAVMFGFLAFLLNFIPTVGSIIATLLPLPVILLSPEMGPTAKILALAIPAAIQIYLGNALQPRVLGNALDLHPIVVLISLIFWGMIWGLPGAFLATPMTAVLRIVLEKIPATRPIAELLAGRIEAVF